MGTGSLSRRFHTAGGGGCRLWLKRKSQFAEGFPNLRILEKSSRRGVLRFRGVSRREVSRTWGVLRGILNLGEISIRSSGLGRNLAKTLSTRARAP